jgi:hypothetical protein
MKKIQMLFIALVAGLLVESCGKNSPAHPLFGEILNEYNEALLNLDGKSYKTIKKSIKDVVEKAKQEGQLPVSGNPYGISCSKAVIHDYNINQDKINIIVELVPDNGTDFHLEKYIGPYGKLVECRMMAGDRLLLKTAAWYTHNKLKITLPIHNKEIDLWRELDHIELTEHK